MTGILPQGVCLLNTRAARLHRLKKTVLNSARIITDSLAATAAGRKYRAAFVTLTYAPDVHWKPDHISAYMDRVKQWLKRQGVPARYVWVAELQQRGAVHYHVMLWLPRHLVLPKSDRRGWWPHGMTKTERARKPVGYMAKYASKLDSKEGKFPAGIRLHGAAGLEKAGRAECRWWNYPKWIREKFPLDRASQLRRAVRGGGFIDPDTGGVHRSEYAKAMFCTVDGDKSVVFVKPGYASSIPQFIRDSRTVAAVRNVLTTSSNSLQVVYRFLEKCAEHVQFHSEEKADSPWWERFPVCSSEDDYDIIDGRLAVTPYTGR